MILAETKGVRPSVDQIQKSLKKTKADLAGFELDNRSVTLPQYHMIVALHKTLLDILQYENTDDELLHQYILARYRKVAVEITRGLPTRIVQLVTQKVLTEYSPSSPSTYTTEKSLLETVGFSEFFDISRNAEIVALRLLTLRSVAHQLQIKSPRLDQLTQILSESLMQRCPDDTPDHQFADLVKRAQLTAEIAIEHTKIFPDDPLDISAEKFKRRKQLLYCIWETEKILQTYQL